MKRLARGQIGRGRGPALAGGPLLWDRNASLYANPEKWDGEAAGSVRDERIYYCTDHQGSVVALVGPGGALVEQARYSANGVPFGLPLGDVDADGDCDGADDTLHKAIEATGVYDVRGDLDLDGDVDSADLALISFHNGTVAGRGLLSTQATRNDMASVAHGWMGTLRFAFHAAPFESLLGVELTNQEMENCFAPPLPPGRKPRIIWPSPLPPPTPGEFVRGTPCSQSKVDGCARQCEAHGGAFGSIRCYEITSRLGVRRVAVCGCYDPFT